MIESDPNAQPNEDRDPSGGVQSEGESEEIPEAGGYAGRDPKTEMPRIPTVPETQDDAPEHDAAPDDKERDAGD